ncbi:MAG: hypothetical protein QXT77_06200, partial [Candidatus Methanomethylicaceae archaeon]
MAEPFLPTFPCKASRGRGVRFCPDALDRPRPASCPLHLRNLVRSVSPKSHRPNCFASVPLQARFDLNCGVNIMCSS